MNVCNSAGEEELIKKLQNTEAAAIILEIDSMDKFDWRKILMNYRNYFFFMEYNKIDHVLISKEPIKMVLFDHSSKINYLELKNQRFFLHNVVVRMPFGKITLYTIKNYAR